MTKRDIKDKTNKILITVVASFGILILVGLFSFIIKESIPALTEVGAEIFTSYNWYPTYSDAEYGMLTMIIDSLLITLLSAVIVLPIGYIIAFFMYGYANKIEKNIIKSSIDLLSGVPSVVIGTFLIIYISPWMLKIGAWSAENIFLGSIGLSILSLPYTASLMQEALDAIDPKLKESALALGSSRFTAGFKIVSKAAISGIFNSIILSINRIIGETMVVLMAAGGANLIPKSIFDPVRPLTAAIASEMGEVELGSLHYSSLFVAGLILLTISFLLTLTSKRLTRKWTK
ncbi:phosphate ABC transporter membrane protein 1 (PhoT family) [Oceanotoga teriensis]|uniref:Phosphate ABC transporter membrane protein 1 (PhoT family) n=1 Tax=Oceanotoga teriensis TaxID=515440 RepID=A0AA45HIC4_9BACT|nr:PstC family ABC transporter permease [Oceanotoga teriensis]PWJ90083.1 phosphate ABC transporter membrane protein 1 (PhoT family) [Oceanotoga teriensis]